MIVPKVFRIPSQLPDGCAWPARPTRILPGRGSHGSGLVRDWAHGPFRGILQRSAAQGCPAPRPPLPGDPSMKIVKTERRRPVVHAAACAMLLAVPLAALAASGNARFMQACRASSEHPVIDRFGNVRWGNSF